MTRPAPSPSPTPAPEPGPPRRVLDTRTPEDVLAAVPAVLGFEPSHSLVMLTFGGLHAFHARVDLPPPEHRDAADDLAAVLLEPALRHGVQRIVLVVYTDDETLARRVTRSVERAFTGAGIEVVHRMRADGSRWWGPGASAEGVPYDVGNHPFRVRSVLDGVVTHGSRAELAATVATDVAAAGRVAALLTCTAPLDPEDVAEVVDARTADGQPFSDAELAGLALGLCSPPSRDAAWAEVRQSTAPVAVRLWSDAARRVPPDLLGGPAAVLALVAWLAGHGALAWCAVDRSLRADPGNSLALLVSDMLVGAVPPSTWDEVAPR